MESLDVYLKGRKVGVLQDAVRGLVFSYDADYAGMSASEPLSFSLLVREETYDGAEVEAYFSFLEFAARRLCAHADRRDP